MLETEETLTSPEDYFRIRAATDDVLRWDTTSPGRFHTDYGPVRGTVVRRLPEGLLLPGDGEGRPLLGVPASFPTEGAPADWPKDWQVLLSDYRYAIHRGQL
jgi:hypothetical protein